MPRLLAEYLGANRTLTLTRTCQACLLPWESRISEVSRCIRGWRRRLKSSAFIFGRRPELGLAVCPMARSVLPREDRAPPPLSPSAHGGSRSAQEMDTLARELWRLEHSKPCYMLGRPMVGITTVNPHAVDESAPCLQVRNASATSQTGCRRCRAHGFSLFNLRFRSITDSRAATTRILPQAQLGGGGNTNLFA